MLLVVGVLAYSHFFWLGDIEHLITLSFVLLVLIILCTIDGGLSACLLLA